jgi:hypothetical protein
MTTIGFQNPSTTDVILDSIQVAAGSPPTNREILVIGDSTGANVTLVGGRVPVDGSGVTQPVSFSGNVTVIQPTAGNLNATVVFAAPQHVIVDSGSVSITGTPTVDVSDRAARLVGVVYGSQAQQLKQTVTNFNLQVELATGATLYDARQIRALTSSDVVTVAQATAANLNATVVFGSPQHVIVDSGSISITGTPTVDVTDRAARLLGVVYGSQAQQLKQTATNFNLQVELATGGTLYDARQIRALTSADVVTAAQVTAANLNATVVFASPQHIIVDSGTITANQGGAPWSQNLTQVGGAAVSLGAKTSANSIPVVLATDEATLPVSIAATVNVSVQNATLAVTQSTSPWVDNISQFGGSNVVTGTGVSGAGIPRVTVSSDSFPATQAVSAVSLPLPVNAAQETGGNLATLVSQTSTEPQINDTLNMILGQLKLLNLNIATCIPSAYVDSDTYLLDSIPTSGR